MQARRGIARLTVFFAIGAVAAAIGTPVGVRTVSAPVEVGHRCEPPANARVARIPDPIGGELAEVGYVDYHEQRLVGAVRGCTFTECNLREADLSGLDLRDARFLECDMRRAKLTRADLKGARFERCDLRGAVMTGADFRVVPLGNRRAGLKDVDLRDADLRGVSFEWLPLRGCDLRGADLSGADLSKSEWADCDLRGARLRNVSLWITDLRHCDLRGADLTGTLDDGLHTRWPEGFDPRAAGARWVE